MIDRLRQVAYGLFLALMLAGLGYGAAQASAAGNTLDHCPDEPNVVGHCQTTSECIDDCQRVFEHDSSGDCFEGCCYCKI